MVHRLDDLRDAARVAFWLDDPRAPAAAESLVGSTTADLAVVGGGFTGLWTALLAKERGPNRDVVLLDADRCGWAASGRNGGFCSASLTHGRSNGESRFPGEIARLDELGHENLDEIEATVGRLQINCAFERTGDIVVATAPYQVAELRRLAEGEHGSAGGLEYLDRDAVQAEVASPTYLAGLWDRSSVALCNPAYLAWGLRRACLDAGVRIFEHTPVDAIDDSARVTLRTSHGQVVADRVALATNAYPSPVRRLRRYIVPVYDYVLMTEPLTPAQLSDIGWRNRQGLGGAANLFLYYRLSADNRILFGGYDAIYHYGNALRPSLEDRPRTFARLLELFDATFPQLESVAFTHAWAGAIDTCTRFCVFFDRSSSGRVVSAAGFTGLGVGASRFAAQVLGDLASGADTERTRLAFVRKKPLPFPPEPLRYAGIQATRRSLARADRQEGRRNVWLRALDRVGLGFDS
ncbi:MAG: NAD(P)/FAD-dependent oxidoreductase [Acidimicrobiales bacterium]